MAPPAGNAEINAQCPAALFNFSDLGQCCFWLLPSLLGLSEIVLLATVPDGAMCYTGAGQG